MQLRRSMDRVRFGTPTARRLASICMAKSPCRVARRIDVCIIQCICIDEPLATHSTRIHRVWVYR